MTLKKVAELANVSTATVSLVLNGFEGSRVSEATKNRVFKAVKELNYKPNLIAQRLVLQKTNTIGLFIPFTSPIFRNYTIIETVGGIQDADLVSAINSDPEAPIIEYADYCIVGDVFQVIPALIRSLSRTKVTTSG